MIPLREEDAVEAETTFDRVFEWTPTERPDLWVRGNNTYMLYPQSYVLTDEVLPAVRSAAEAADGQSTYFLRLLERSSNVPEYWSVDWAEGNTYELSAPVVDLLENVIYSKSGNWGVYFSQDQYALIGGDSLFVESVAFNLEMDFDTQLHQFEVDQRRRSIDVSEFVSSLRKRLD
jgi:hypothetical protein